MKGNFSLPVCLSLCLVLAGVPASFGQDAAAQDARAKAAIALAQAQRERRDTVTFAQDDARKTELIEKVTRLVARDFAGDDCKAFAHYDRNSDGRLDRPEILSLLSDAGVGNALTRGRWADGIIAAVDADGDRAVSLVEYQALRQCANAECDAKCKAALALARAMRMREEACMNDLAGALAKQAATGKTLFIWIGMTCEEFPVVRASFADAIHCHADSNAGDATPRLLVGPNAAGQYDRILKSDVTLDGVRGAAKKLPTRGTAPRVSDGCTTGF